MLLSSLVLATASAVVVQAAPEATFNAGSEVSLEAFSSVKWIQGEGPKSFEPDKIYIFECWATWCGPCIAVIPHVNELHLKYKDKGVYFYGMNVWEDGEDKVRKFVKDKGEGMSYPVAYTGKGSQFEKDWLVAGGVRGIPHAFVVRNGKLVIKTHPSKITEKFIDALLTGDVAATADIAAADSIREKSSKLMMDFRKAHAAGEAAKMEELLAEFEKLDTKSPYLPAMKLDLLTAKKDWPGAIKWIEEMPEGPAQKMSMTMTASKIAMRTDDEYPADFIKAVAKSYSTMVSDPKTIGGSMNLITLSTLQWKSGDKEAALASAKKAAEPKVPVEGGREISPESFERFAKEVEAGKLPTMRDFSGWLRESMKNQAAAPAVPAAELKPAADAKPTEEAKEK